MSQSLRLSEKWFNRGLWVIALVFAGFLIGLGNVIVGDLPQVDGQITRDDFIDHAGVDPLRVARDAANARAEAANPPLEQAELRLRAAQQAYFSGRETFENWVSTRTATARPEQDAELVARTAALDTLKAAEDTARIEAEAQRQIRLDATQARDRAVAAMAPYEQAAQSLYEAALQRSELRVFLYRLALTLPLLVIAGWLFVRQRKSQWWPFVWGFILFALFAFFVELVPYLPSYGGYVRFITGIIITVLVGRYAIVALNKYLAQQRLAEAQPDKVRRDVLSYDAALARLDKKVCPGCERPVDLKDPAIDFCPHCGIGLFDHCRACDARKNAFSPFCPACGAAAAKVE
ncbi:MAG: zinc ribbon domain-containing protein [Sandarakinorhabdus sp.]|nr:zinc ribbon domain-containing protein [Sandarakinorhabdus sp.]